MKKYLFIAFLLLFVWSCTKDDVTKQEAQTQSTQAEERRGGNGNGNGGGGNNPNTPNYNPCATYEIYPIEYIQTTQSWNFTADTSICGHLIIRWDAQPYFKYVVDSCNPSLGKYFIGVNAVVFDPISSGCAGNYTTTNAYYYTYGAGCSIWGGNREYDMNIGYYYRDTTAKKTYVYNAPTFRFTTGLKSVWQCN